MSGAIGVFTIGVSTLADAPVITAHPGFALFLAEVEAYKPGAATIAVDQGHGTHPRGTLAQFADAIESTGTILASDVGYRTLPTDAQGVVPYPPLLEDAFQIDCRMNLEPSASAAAASWGGITLANPGGRFDAIAAVWNSDGRPATILYGRKVWDATRQLYTDPPYATMAQAFKGVATPWFLGDKAFTIPLRDATYWLERPYQTNYYTGTGGYNGTAALTGKPIPRTRGGTAAFPVRNVTPTLLDPLNRIYQYNDGPGTVTALYEGAAQVIAYATDTADLYSGGVPPGQYRTDNSRGLFQLGSVPVHIITADVTGNFPASGPITTAVLIAFYMLTEDMAVPLPNIDNTSFYFSNINFPYVAGLYFGSDDPASGVDAISRALSGWAGKMVPFRDGTLRVFGLRAMSPADVATGALTTVNLVSLVPRPLPPTLDPPPYRVRVEAERNWTIQTTDINTASADQRHVQKVALTGYTATWSSVVVLAAYRRPNDFAPITGSLLNIADAISVAIDMGALWGVRRRLYDATVPASLGFSLNISDIVSLRYPMDNLVSGQLGRVVGWQFRSTDQTVTFQVLV